jgi:hypothetical protein
VTVASIVRQWLRPARPAIEAVVFLSPVRRGEEHAVASAVAELDATDPSPLAATPVHFSRFALVDSLSLGIGDAGRAPLRSSYLLFAPAFDGDLDGLLASLRTGPMAGVSDRVWGHCVGYPGAAAGPLFDDYLWRCRLPSPLVIPGYAGTVGEVRSALAVRSGLAALAGEAPGLGDAELRSRFLAVMGEDVR